MAAPSLAHHVPQSTDQRQSDRVLRGQELYFEHKDDFVHRNSAWLVASDTVPGRIYEVRLGPVESCECADHEHRGSRCKHIIAASIAHAKSRVCSCCGQQVLSRFTTEVAEGDGLLTWFPGDVICADCIREGFWA